MDKYIESEKSPDNEDPAVEQKLETNMRNDVVVIFEMNRCIKENIAYGNFSMK